ncbi:MAG: sigma-70 family RNA polymerase sigma factor [Bacteroidetes bacterium]|nr:sigma-70 family RNA polymerase sigma factor [Rhodothermia bacterium]MCS7155693.1 sigma-70 family RNA polymerase sigma factor [Bacteroidota bacterium]MCX7906552.1 sigma-70 family RNA polymerase sigma factor [Bacteroidota bacterium]MDW8137167.1 sigma-70 family RNA polymerase sigma factor [Bacteroidota bacterium]MDW8284963.1 sigma-70 family RNA polymerase sigma factor [Bacteroidota bacterium]
MHEEQQPSSSRLEDERWITEALAGHQEAYEQLMRKYRGAIAHHIYRLVRDRAELEDLVQEVFIKAFQSLSAFRQNFAFSTWLYRIATNHAIDYLRRKKLPLSSLQGSDPNGERELEFADPDHRPDRVLWEEERRRIIQEAIERLPPKYRQVIIMRHQQELSYEEIARQLELPLGTVKAHIFRARELLYRYLRAHWDQLFP